MGRAIILTTCFLFLVTNLLPAEGPLSLHGYFKTFLTAFHLPGIEYGNGTYHEPPMGAATNRLRLKLAFIPNGTISIHAAYDISPAIQDPALFQQDIFPAGITGDAYRFDDFPARIYPGTGEPVGSFALNHNLDRLFVTLKTKIGDIVIGRQAIAWGSAKLVNPTDVIAPFTFNELDVEERRGVDALRLRIPIGMMDELDFGVIAGPDFDMTKGAFFARGKFYILQTDLSILAMGFRQHLMFGLDIARSIGGAGFWLEAAVVLPHRLATDIDSKRPNYIRASTGLDYNFGGNLYAFFEFHHNGAGSNDPALYIDNFLTPAYTDGSVYLMAQNYLNLGATYQLHPLIPVTAILIFNLDDGSFTFAPSAEYNIAENIYLAAGAYISSGKSPTPFPQSEFGLYPTMVYTAFRIYF
jgi:hypothetical protein